MTAVRVDGLSKVFRSRRGPVRAVDGISFTVDEGEVFGLLGPNGAGKTTALRMLSTLILPTAGRAEVYGHDVVRKPQAVREVLGFLTTETGLYERLTPWETLLFFGRIFDLAPDSVLSRAEAVLRLLGLWELRDRRVGVLSTGERQKLSFARCLIHDPPLLVLDEPTAGMDVFVARAAVSLIQELKGAGKTVILATHDIRLAGKLCDRVGILHRGGLIVVGSPDDLRREAGGEDFEDAFFRTVARALPTNGGDGGAGHRQIEERLIP